MIAHRPPSPVLVIAALFAFLVFLPGCLIGIGIGPIAIGAGVGSSAVEHTAELEAGGIRIDDHRVSIQVERDTTYSAKFTTRRTLLTPAGVRAAQRASRIHDPRHQSLDVVEAYVVTPEGKRINVPSASIFTRPSEAAQNTPGFVKSLTTTVVFPQLRVGSQTYVSWKFVENGRSTLGFNFLYRPELTLPVTNAVVSITHPRALPLQYRERGGFQVETTGEATAVQTITATLESYEGYAPEREMVAPTDVVPVFVASTLPGWHTIGNSFYEAVADKVEVTPEIQALADELSEGLEGLDAARAIYHWLCRNIHYVAVYLNSTDSWTPNAASEVLRNGYGDCKDKYVLFASLLRARGIAAEPVLVSWSDSFERLPLWTPAQFDHCIAYLPEFRLYANPTNPYADLGVLDQALSGKFVVHAVEGGGRTARTPSTQPERHLYEAEHAIVIDESGNVAGTSHMSFKGRPAAYFREVLATSGRLDDVATDSLLGSPEGGSGEFEFTTDPTDLDTPLRCEASWNTEGAIDMRGDRIQFAVPTGVEFASASRARPFLTGDDRKFPVVVATVEGHWVHTIELASGFTAHELPLPRSVENPCGSYTSRYDLENDGRIRVERRLRLQKDVVMPSGYPRLRDILQAWVQDSRAIIEVERRPTP